MTSTRLLSRKRARTASPSSASPSSASTSPASARTARATRTSFAALTATIALFAVTACGASAPAASNSNNASASSSSTVASGSTITVSHAQGSTQVPANPQNVYVFDLGVLDTMNALGLKATGIPETVLPASLKDFQGATKIGSMKEPDFEKISEGAPDLIIISGRTAGSYGELSKIAPTIDLSVDQKDALNSFKKNAEIIGDIYGKKAEVDAQLKEIDAKIAEVSAKGKDAGKSLVVMSSAGELTAYGAGSRFGLVHDILKFPTAADIKSQGPHGEAVSFEFIKEKNPGILFVVDRDSAMGTATGSSNAVLDNELVKSTDAAKNNKIIQLDATNWYNVGYGLNNTKSMIDEVAKAL